VRNRVVTKQTGARNKSNKYVATGATVSSALLAAHSVIPAIAFAANRYDWSQHAIVNEDRHISEVSMSAGGSHLAVIGGEGNPGLYISNNSGSTWENVSEEVDPGRSYIWTSVDLSNDGQTIVATSDEGYDTAETTWIEGRIFLSEDGGDSWNNITPIDDDYWSEVVVSGDGSTIAVGASSNGNVYVTENDGVDWATNAYIEGAVSVKNLAISDNGNKILAGGENGDDIYTHLAISDDTGGTWTSIDPDAEDNIGTLIPAISADGNTIAVATSGYSDDYNDSVFISENDGVDWADVAPEDDGPSEWVDLALSDDASTLTVIDGNNRKMYLSDDQGANWTEENPSEDYEDTSDWAALDLSSNGTKFIVASGAYVYLNSSDETGNENTVTLDDAVGGKTISITTPEGTTITCHSAAKEYDLDVTDASYTYPLGLVDFCFSGADTSNEINLIFVTDLKPDEVLVRKYNSNTNEYATISDTDVSQTTYEGKNALLVTYNIVDNGPLDLDPDDGEVADPVGLAIADTNALADTGDNASTARLVAIGLLGIGFFYLLRRRPRLLRDKTS
jgi:photosystem II stability/assembly factor-like uncharacterized protein